MNEPEPPEPAYTAAPSIEYAFDVELTAVLRVRARSREEAVEVLNAIDCCSTLQDTFFFIDGKPKNSVHLTEFTVNPQQVALFEEKGKEVDPLVYFKVRETE